MSYALYANNVIGGSSLYENERHPIIRFMVRLIRMTFNLALLALLLDLALCFHVVRTHNSIRAYQKLVPSFQDTLVDMTHMPLTQYPEHLPLLIAMYNPGDLSYTPGQGLTKTGRALWQCATNRGGSPDCTVKIEERIKHFLSR